jgi:hypothetical protein
MEGRDLAALAVAKSPGGPAKYDKARSGGALLTATTPAYATDADVHMGDDEDGDAEAVAGPSGGVNGVAAVNGEEPKKAKKVRFSVMTVCWAVWSIRVARCNVVVPSSLLLVLLA